MLPQLGHGASLSFEFVPEPLRLPDRLGARLPQVEFQLGPALHVGQPRIGLGVGDEVTPGGIRHSAGTDEVAETAH